MWEWWEGDLRRGMNAEKENRLADRKETYSSVKFCYVIHLAVYLERSLSHSLPDSFMSIALSDMSVIQIERQRGGEKADRGVFSTSIFMQFLICKPLKLCSSLLSERKNKRGSASEPVVEPTPMPSLLRHLQNARAADKTGSKRFDDTVASRARDQTVQESEKKGSVRRSKSQSRHSAHRDFLKATALGVGTVFTDPESLPNRDAAYTRFKEVYPRFLDTVIVDEVREEEYGHLKETGRVCLDYCGFGLFSHLQQLEQWESASFALTETSVNLCAHALFGAAEEGTMEFDIRKRIMQYLHIQETDYSMVFTVSRGATFKLLADAYPFETCNRLLTMYDYESESVGFMVQRAKEKGAKTSNASFKWPSLRICSTELRKQLVAKRRRKGPVKGLFVFPVQSRVSGAKYSYQWMSLAQQNKWHVLLDASALGPKDMDSLGLSLFRPDFIIASFYKVFGADASGFGCLLIKNSAIQSIQDPSGSPAFGIVRIIPFPNQWLSGSSGGHSDGGDEFEDLDGEGMSGRGIMGSELQRDVNLAPMVSSFSGPMLGSNKHATPDEDRDRLPCIEGSDEEEEEDSSVCEDIENVFVGGVTRSPVFSEDGTDNLFCIDIGPSPIGTASRTSISEDAFSGPFRSFSGPFRSFSGPIRNPVNTPLIEVQKPISENHQVLEKGTDVQCATSQMEWSSSGHLQGESTFNAVDEADISSSEDSEDMDVTESSTRDKTNKEKVAEVELLDPGTSPFLDANTFQESSFNKAHNMLKFGPAELGGEGKMGNCREINSECIEEEMICRDQDLPHTVVENGRISPSTQNHEYGKGEVTMVDMVNETNCEAQFSEESKKLYKEEKSGGGSSEGITEMKIEPDILSEKKLEINGHDSLESKERYNLSTSFEIQESSSVEKQKGKEKASLTTWNQSESAIRRETEGDFRLLGRRTGDRFSFGRNISMGLHESEEFTPTQQRVSFSCNEERTRDPYFGRKQEGSTSAAYQDKEEIGSDEENAEQETWFDREPQVFCQGLDHADMMGLNKTNIRLRCLINWLISSLLQLRHPGPEKDLSLVQVYGPQVRFDRGASVAFNLYDCHGKMLHPELVQMLADKNGISLGIGFLRNLRFTESHLDVPVPFDRKKETAEKVGNGLDDLGRIPSRVQVVTAALGLLSNFEDAHRMWMFVARFLDADFVSKETGCHQSPNRDSISLVS